MYKAPVFFLLCRNPSPCAASLAGRSKPSSLSIFYELWHRASFIIFQPKFYCGCYKKICLNGLYSPSQRNINDDLSLALLFRNRGCFIQTTKWRGNHGITECLFFRLFSKRSLASSSASNLASAFFWRSSATSVVSTLVPLSASAVRGPGPGPFPLLILQT